VRTHHAHVAIAALHHDGALDLLDDLPRLGGVALAGQQLLLLGRQARAQQTELGRRLAAVEQLFEALLLLAANVLGLGEQLSQELFVGRGHPAGRAALLAGRARAIVEQRSDHAHHPPQTRAVGDVVVGAVVAILVQNAPVLGSADGVFDNDTRLRDLTCIGQATRSE
jgi:hypothetical protein